MRIRSRFVLAALTATAVAVGGWGVGQPGTASAYPAIADPIVVTHDGGLNVLDDTTLRTAAGVPLTGFDELDPAGDDRHADYQSELGFHSDDRHPRRTPSGLVALGTSRLFQHSGR